MGTKIIKNELLNEVESFLQRNDISLSGESIVLGVSTGVDSMVLLDLFINLKEKLDFKLNVCHVNHKRRLQSEEEEAFLKEYLDGICPLYVLHFESDTSIDANFQEIARNKRLNFFKDTLKQINGKYLVLAHHLNDDIETSFMHLIRSGSLDSICGIKEVNEFDSFTIIRPLIRVLKSDLYQYAKENNIKYYEDESNTHDDYTRNRIRHNIVSELFKENPSFNDSFISYKEKLSYASDLMNKYRDELIKNNIIIEDNSIKFNYLWFNGLDNVIQKEILFELFKKKQLSSDNINELIKIIKTDKTSFVNNYLDLSIIKGHGHIIINNNTYIKKDINIVIDEYKTYLLNDKYSLKVSKCSNSEFLDAKKCKNIISNINVLWYNSIRLPYIVRGRCDGDEILLSSGHKKVKDLLIDNHLSQLEKDNTLLLIDNESDIISVLGIRKSKKVEDNNFECDVKIELIENH